MAMSGERCPICTQRMTECQCDEVSKRRPGLHINSRGSRRTDRATSRITLAQIERHASDYDEIYAASVGESIAADLRTIATELLDARALLTQAKEYVGYFGTTSPPTRLYTGALDLENAIAAFLERSKP